MKIGSSVFSYCDKLSDVKLIDDFVGDAPQFDDLTMLSIKLL